jgi:hypothetical protein
VEAEKKESENELSELETSSESGNDQENESMNEQEKESENEQEKESENEQEKESENEYLDNSSSELEEEIIEQTAGCFCVDENEYVDYSTGYYKTISDNNIYNEDGERQGEMVDGLFISDD